MALVLCVLRIFCAYVVAIAIAAIVFIEAVLDLTSGATPWQINVALEIVPKLFRPVALNVTAVALLPTIIAGLVTWRAGATSALWHLAMGVGVGLGATMISLAWFTLYIGAPLSQPGGSAYLIARFAAAVIIAGAADGLTFWAVAGRNANSI